jgi:hypothetical protein
MAENVFPAPWLKIPLDVSEQENVLYRFARKTWQTCGIDSYTAPPAQNPDMFEILNNILPPQTGVLRRRWGYRAFAPIYDQGGVNGDGI